MIIDRDYELMREERDAAEARATAAEGERDALREERKKYVLRWTAAESALAEARGALRDLLAACEQDNPIKGMHAEQRARAALALPYSPQGRPPEVMSGRLGGGEK